MVIPAIRRKTTYTYIIGASQPFVKGILSCFAEFGTIPLFFHSLCPLISTDLIFGLHNIYICSHVRSYPLFPQLFPQPSRGKPTISPQPVEKGVEKWAVGSL